MIPEPKRRVATYLEVLLAVAFWGASFVATKVALRDLSPSSVVWLRFGIGVILLGVVLAARRQFALPGGRDLLYYALLGLIGIAFHQWLQSNALVTAQAATSGWIIATTPVFMALLGVLVLKEKLTGIQAGGILLAAVGVLLIMGKGSLRGVLSGQSLTRGDVLMLISSPNWAIFSALSRRAFYRHPPIRVLFYVMLFGWMIVTAEFLAQGRLAEVGSISLDGWLAVLFLGIFCSGLAYIFWYDGINTISSAEAGAFLYLEPLVTLVVALVILGEPLGWYSLAGGVVILAGVWLVNHKAHST